MASEQRLQLVQGAWRAQVFRTNAKVVAVLFANESDQVDGVRKSVVARLPRLRALWGVST